MLMVLGLFVFERRTLPYQSMVFTKDYRWASNERIGKPKAWQYLGEGETSLTFPDYFTRSSREGGFLSRRLS